MKKIKGFTLIELLVIISIIGLLSTLVVVSFGSTRKKARDARRLADVKQLQTALELYYNNNHQYPIVPGDDDSAILGAGTNCEGSVCSCLDDAGITASCAVNPIYMGIIPAAPTIPAGSNYIYTAFDNTDVCNDVDMKCDTYRILFTLEKVNETLGDGVNCTATPKGVTCSLLLEFIGVPVEPNPGCDGDVCPN